MSDNGTITRPWFFLCVLLLFVLHNSCFSLSSRGDTLSVGKFLSLTQTLVSQGNIFELGFFNKGTSEYSPKFYLGIWYKNVPYQAIVWVANREQILSEPSSKLEFSKDGNLVLLNDFSKNIFIWSTNIVSPTPNSTETVLLDNGNFVVRDVTNPSTIYWQSFDHPTDALLPGAKIGINKHTGKTKVLTSWKNSYDPAPGRFSFEIDPVERNQYFIKWNNSKRFWSTGVWNGDTFSSVPEWKSIKFLNYSFISNENESYLTYFSSNSSVLVRFVMGLSGNLMLTTWLVEAGRQWDFKWVVPTPQSQVYTFCGAFSIFRDNQRSQGYSCECLQGFEPISIEGTELDVWSRGCVRKTPLQCQNGTYTNGITRKFSKISNMTTLPENSKILSGWSLERCESTCLQNCSCTAYAYNSNGCLVWEEDLLNLQQLSNESDSKQDLYLKLAATDQLYKPSNPTAINKSDMKVIITVPVSLAVLISGGFICCLIRRKLKQMGEKDSNAKEKDSSKDLLLFDFTASTNAAETNTGNNLERNRKKDVELPSFSFASVSAATDNFSAANKLGAGGFGPVYRAKV